MSDGIGQGSTMPSGAFLRLLGIKASNWQMPDVKPATQVSPPSPLPSQPQDAAPSGAHLTSPDEKTQINELVKLMAQSEEKVVVDFNLLY